MKTSLEFYRVVTGDSKEEVMIFRYRQTNRHFIKMNIIFSH